MRDWVVCFLNLFNAEEILIPILPYHCSIGQDSRWPRASTRCEVQDNGANESKSAIWIPHSVEGFIFVSY